MTTPTTSDYVADPAAVASMRSSRPVGHGAVRAYDWIAHHTMHRPAKEAIRDLGTDRSFTYAALDRRVDAMAAYLRSLGIELSVSSFFDSSTYALLYEPGRLIHKGLYLRLVFYLSC